MPQPTIEITASYEFAASHRLHCADRSDEENRRIFGKCNNPNGHGHNYRIEVRCAVPMGSTGAFDAVDAAVENEIMRRFDHRHLNLDCPEFAKLNPSVENIAKICFEYLEAALANAGLQARCVRVHETPKTSAIYPATQF
ncbi:MAG: 6-carboxytetrahydropterin synthase [Phycisphaerales bacterium]|nr:6-carboxytetrahydropterin synthase [Phycisphaerales bacterium]